MEHIEVNLSQNTYTQGALFTHDITITANLIFVNPLLFGGQCPPYGLNNFQLFLRHFYTFAPKDWEILPRFPEHRAAPD